ncbi:adenylate/guanylate cyclase domain-containing protein [Candidatus Bipolaricaulota bacterium]|nr:adenylate/guanylate cyclase domain-containing protein [Candidatus Bipolaricaulota bacterium]
MERDYVAFSRNREIYNQIRVLSAAGMELLSVNYNDGQPSVVLSDDLRNEDDQTFFREMSQCAANSVYVSSLDLNMEHGSIESPLNPVMRFAIQIGNGATPEGFLLLDLAGSVLLDAFANSHPDVEASPLLIDQDGHFTYGLASDNRWRFMLLRETGQDFSDIFPEEWKTVASTETGQFESAAGLFTYTTLTPYEAAGVALCEMTESEQFPQEPDTRSYDVWKNVSWVPSQMLGSVRLAGALQLAGWNAFGILLLGTGSWYFARWLAMRGEKQRLTTQTNTLLESTLQRYMSKEVCHRLLNDPQRHSELGGAAQFVAVLFVDIRGFTGFAEHRDPKDVVAVLNRTLTELVVPLRVYRGILDKYIGDGFLAFFEPERAEADAAQRAVDAALVMQQAFANLWKHAPSADLRSLGLGIGISVGRVIVGNVGTSDAMDYTVIGDAVNVAARLQGLARAGEILMSDRVHALLNDTHVVEHSGLTQLKGRQEPIDIYRLGTQGLTSSDKANERLDCPREQDLLYELT